MIDSNYVLIGDGFEYKDPVSIGGVGFNLTRTNKGMLVHKQHNGLVLIGNNVHIGAFNNIDRGLDLDTRISDNVKTDSHVHIGHDAVIGKSVILSQKSTIGGHCIIGDYSTIWVGAFIHQRVKVGKNCMVGAMTYLRHDLPDNHIAYGNPVIVKHRSEIKYPWVEY